MDEKSIKKLAMIVFFIGLGILFFISGNLDIDEQSIRQIEGLPNDDYVKLKGLVKNINQYDGMCFVTLEQPEEISVIVFDDKNITINKDDNIEVIGKVDEYEGKKEILAELVRIV